MSQGDSLLPSLPKWPGGWESEDTSQCFPKWSLFHLTAAHTLLWGRRSPGHQTEDELVPQWEETSKVPVPLCAMNTILPKKTGPLEHRQCVKPGACHMGNEGRDRHRCLLCSLPQLPFTVTLMEGLIKRPWRLTKAPGKTIPCPAGMMDSVEEARPCPRESHTEAQPGPSSPQGRAKRGNVSAPTSCRCNICQPQHN
jgi:hypothetical protein